MRRPPLVEHAVAVVNEAPVRVRVLKANLNAKTLEVAHGPVAGRLSDAEVARLAEGFCPLSQSSTAHPGEARPRVAPNGWAYCPFGIGWSRLLCAWQLEGVEGPEEGSGG